jgi:hypothetical protein
MDEKEEDQWCEERRDEVKFYLEKEGVKHGRIGEWPAWFVAPYVSVWAIESKKTPESVGWWVICGDLPTDYISSNDANDPRQVLEQISARWYEVANCIQKGEPHPTVEIGKREEWPTLAPLLQSRAEILDDWAKDETLWEEAF